MKKRIGSILLVVAGLTMIFEPLKAIGECGLNPEIIVPGACQAPKAVSPNPSGGTCDEMPDGSCVSVGCTTLTWENAIPGRCGNGIITENGTPRCESNFAATTVTISQYTRSCEKKKSCKCVLSPTGATTTVTVCNCRNLEPAH